MSCSPKTSPGAPTGSNSHPRSAKPSSGSARNSPSPPRQTSPPPNPAPRRLRTDQRNLPLHVLARVVALLRPLAYIHQLRRHVRAFAILRQYDRLCLVTRDLLRRLPVPALVLVLSLLNLLYFLYLPQLSYFRIPRRPRS